MIGALRQSGYPAENLLAQVWASLYRFGEITKIMYLGSYKRVKCDARTSRALRGRYGRNLMKLFLIILFIPVYSFAKDLSVGYAIAGCTEKHNGYYQYAIDAVVQNVGKKDVVVVTESLSVGKVANEAEGDIDAFITWGGDESIEGISIIPSSSSLGLVTLRPGEGAFIHATLMAKFFATSVNVHYQGTEMYGGRFRQWVGTTDGVAVKPTRLATCQP